MNHTKTTLEHGEDIVPAKIHQAVQLVDKITKATGLFCAFGFEYMSFNPGGFPNQTQWHYVIHANQTHHTTQGAKDTLEEVILLFKEFLKGTKR